MIGGYKSGRTSPTMPELLEIMDTKKKQKKLLETLGFSKTISIKGKSKEGLGKKRSSYVDSYMQESESNQIIVSMRKHIGHMRRKQSFVQTKNELDGLKKDLAYEND